MSQRPRYGRLAGGLLLALVAYGCADQPTTPSHPAALPLAVNREAFALGNRPDRYLVSFKSGEPSSFAAKVASLGGKIDRRFGDMNVTVVKGVGAAGASTLAASPGVDVVAQDAKIQFIRPPRQVSRAPNKMTGRRQPGTDQSGAPAFFLQYNIRQVRADQAWSKSTGGRGALVCILDTGIDPDHPELQGKVDPALMTSLISDPTFPGDLDPLDYNFHGTATAGFISTTGFIMASVAPDAKLCSAKVLDKTGSGSFGDVIAGINWAADHHADVINMSLGGTVDVTAPGALDLIRLMERAILRANLKGSVVVASAGNSGIDLDNDPRNLLVVPAQLLGVISVGAVAPLNQMNFDGLSSYSNFGGRTGVDLMAPGGDFVPELGGILDDLLIAPCSLHNIPDPDNALPFNCDPEFPYLLIAGTSESAPHVSAAAAVLKAKFGRLALPILVEACLERSADNVGPRRVFGNGRLDVLGAVGCKN